MRRPGTAGSALLYFSRDVVQLVVSTRYVNRTNTVVIGAHWHMSYGLAMLAWGSIFILNGHPPVWATTITAAVSVATFADYTNRCRQLERLYLPTARTAKILKEWSLLTTRGRAPDPDRDDGKDRSNSPDDSVARQEAEHLVAESYGDGLRRGGPR